MEHQSFERKWIDKAILHIAQLDNSDATYQPLAVFDVDLEKYGRMCSSWRPRYFGDKHNFPTTTEKTDVARLQKAVEDKMYTILKSGNSSIANRIGAINIFRDEAHFFNRYIIKNGGASFNTLNRAGLYDIYRKKGQLAKENDRKLGNSTNSANGNNRQRANSVSSIGPTEAEMKEALL